MHLTPLTTAFQRVHESGGCQTGCVYSLLVRADQLKKATVQGSLNCFMCLYSGLAASCVIEDEFKLSERIQKKCKFFTSYRCIILLLSVCDTLHICMYVQWFVMGERRML